MGNDKTIYFDASKLPNQKNEYVCWLDVMGTRSIMSSSLSKSANFICKLHIAILSKKKEDIRIYPLLDGAYVTSKNKNTLLEFLKEVFQVIAEDFIAQGQTYHKFVIKAAIAYGPTLHGSDIPASASKELDDNPEHRKSLLLGIPVIQAYQSETKAPPFGVFIHESARSFSSSQSKPLQYIWWKWFNKGNELRQRLDEELKKYYLWCSKNTHTLLYDLPRIEEHKKMAEEYFAEISENLLSENLLKE